ncbi:hypothetical protein [Nocardioides massiliensis]|uniref:DUF1761 domain-containing protein n=1 Tax=Nocardioides massiliensis TaxID=1325935 RepID=A0ABT9NPB4_9ACTN|nr:hypothetical protein [Nocardioides massiliensis]MDP9822263.1 hypothetical protein [Nocardioides massiliensis]
MSNRNATVVPAVVTALLFAASAPFALYPAFYTAAWAWALPHGEVRAGALGPLTVYAGAFAAQLVVPVVAGVLLRPPRPWRFVGVALGVEFSLWFVFLAVIGLAA